MSSRETPSRTRVNDVNGTQDRAAGQARRVRRAPWSRMASEKRPAAAHGRRAARGQDAITSANGLFPTLIGFPGVLVAVVIGVTVPAV